MAERHDVHFHINHHLGSYMPSNPDHIIWGEDAGELIGDLFADTLYAVADELDSWAENLYEQAEIHAEGGDYEAAWKARKHSDHLDILRRNAVNLAAQWRGHKDRASAFYKDTTLAGAMHDMLEELHHTELDNHTLLDIRYCFEVHEEEELQWA